MCIIPTHKHNTLQLCEADLALLLPHLMRPIIGKFCVPSRATKAGKYRAIWMRMSAQLMWLDTTATATQATGAKHTVNMDRYRAVAGFASMHARQRTSRQRSVALGTPRASGTASQMAVAVLQWHQRCKYLGLGVQVTYVVAVGIYCSLLTRMLQLLAGPIQPSSTVVQRKVRGTFGCTMLHMFNFV